MTLSQLLVAGWHPKPEVFAGCALLGAAYLLGARPPAGRALLFLGGLAVLLLSLVSPLDTLAHTYLFSAHMAQHLLLTLIAPPLLLLGLPPRFVRRLLAPAPLRRIEGALARPLPAWGLATATMWIWHLPALYGLALGDNGIHVAQHLLFLATATLFWWPVLAPAEEPAALAPWAATLYLFTAMASGSVLGIILTFAPPGLYPAYLRPADALGLLPLIRGGWGLTPDADQQLGGLLMWIPGGFIYSLALIGTLARWFDAPEEEVAAPEPGVGGEPAAVSPVPPGEPTLAGVVARAE